MKQRKRMLINFALLQVSLQAKQLMYRLLHRDPKNRLGSREGANEVKQHPFFRGINWALVRCMVITETLVIKHLSGDESLLFIEWNGRNSIIYKALEKTVIETLVVESLSGHNLFCSLNGMEG